MAKGKVTAPVFKESIHLILRISYALGSSDKKEEVDLNLLCLWERPTGNNYRLTMDLKQTYSAVNIY